MAEAKRLASAEREARRCGATRDEVLQHWAKDEGWCSRCRAWFDRCSHTDYDCHRLHGLCGCGGTPRPRRRTCTRCAARGRTAPRVSTAALLEAVLLHAHLLPAPLVEQVRAALERVR